MFLYNLQPTLPIEPQYEFGSEPALSAEQKLAVLKDWRYFIRSGFQAHTFTNVVYNALTAYCGFSAQNQAHSFWAHYFNSDVVLLRAIVEQFGGSHIPVELPQQGTTWLMQAPVVDLKVAMCEEMALIAGAYIYVIDEQLKVYGRLAQTFYDFALNNGVDTPVPPPSQIIPGDHIRWMLAYAAASTLTVMAKQQSEEVPIFLMA